MTLQEGEMVKNIVFDLGGVIIPLNRVACIRAFDEIVGYKEFARMLNAYRQIGFFDSFETGRISARKFRQIIRANSSHIKDGKARIVTDRQIDYSLNRYLGDIPQDKIETLLFYRDGYRLFLLSNTNPIGMSYAKKLFMDKGYKVTELFEELFLSYKMGVAKPSKEIYDRMIRKTGIAPQETLFIDDSPANIETAASMGFQVILYNPKDDLYGKISEYLEREQR